MNFLNASRINSSTYLAQPTSPTNTVDAIIVTLHESDNNVISGAYNAEELIVAMRKCDVDHIELLSQ